LPARNGDLESEKPLKAVGNVRAERVTQLKLRVHEDSGDVRRAEPSPCPCVDSVLFTLSV